MGRIIIITRPKSFPGLFTSWIFTSLNIHLPEYSPHSIFTSLNIHPPFYPDYFIILPRLSPPDYFFSNWILKSVLSRKSLTWTWTFVWFWTQRKLILSKNSIYCQFEQIFPNLQFLQVTWKDGANSWICNRCKSEYVGIWELTKEITVAQNVIFSNIRKFDDFQIKLVELSFCNFFK